MKWKKIKGFTRYSVSYEGKVRNDETGKILNISNCILGKRHTAGGYHWDAVE